MINQRNKQNKILMAEKNDNRVGRLKLGQRAMKKDG